MDVALLQVLCFPDPFEGEDEDLDYKKKKKHEEN